MTPPPGPELDRLFFETCLGGYEWYHRNLGVDVLRFKPADSPHEHMGIVTPCVSTDIKPAHGYVLPYLRQHGRLLLVECPDGVHVTCDTGSKWAARGDSWAHALTLLAIEVARTLTPETPDGEA